MSLSEEIDRLAALHERGVLTPDEFAQAKARVIATASPGPTALGGADWMSRLRRSSADRWLGGVCGGIARLTGIETWAWRLAFTALLLFWGVGFVLYILLWVFVPLEGEDPRINY